MILDSRVMGLEIREPFKNDLPGIRFSKMNKVKSPRGIQDALGSGVAC